MTIRGIAARPEEFIGICQRITGDLLAVGLPLGERLIPIRIRAVAVDPGGRRSSTELVRSLRRRA
jgi:hypothetical protein